MADSGDSKKEIVRQDGSNPDGGPGTEKTESVPEAPTGNNPPPPVDIAEKSEKDKKLNKLFWMRVVLAVIAGVASTFLFEGIEGEERRWASIAFMIIIFFATVIIAKEMRMQLPSSDRKKIVTQAIGSYVFLYLFSWIVSYTLTHMGDASGGINL